MPRFSVKLFSSGLTESRPLHNFALPERDVPHDGIAEEVKMIVQWEQEVRAFAEHPVFGSVVRMMSGMSWACMDTIKNIKAQLDEQLATVAQMRLFPPRRGFKGDAMSPLLYSGSRK
jgi:hypothetical protein